jgi:assimilatory nitrate reductase catalytic subunit
VEPFVEIHPEDAERYGLMPEALAELQSAWGKMRARVQISASQKPGNVFVPMHWTAQYASNGRMGALVNPAFDPISKQPECKHTPVAISPYHAAWYGFLLSRTEIKLGIDMQYWVSSKGPGFYRYELAGEQGYEYRSVWAGVILPMLEGENIECLEYQDSGTGEYRTAYLQDGRLQAVLMLSPDYELPSRSWLAELFSKPQLQPQERKALLTGMPASGTSDVGAIICSCFNVGEKTIIAAIAEQQLKTVLDVGRCLKAGTNCGSCLPEIGLLFDKKTA